MSGLIEKYILQRADGKPISPKAKFFCLRYDPDQKDDRWREACCRAIAAFAENIQDFNSQLADDLRKEISESRQNARLKK